MCGSKMKTINKHDVEIHSTRGTYNGFGYLAHSIKYDENKVICSSDNLLNEDIDWEVDRSKLGGIIVLSANINAVPKYNNNFGWTVGKYLHGRYKAKDGTVFDENSISVELLNVSVDTIISFAEELCKEFSQETVLVKLYGEDRILFVKPKEE